MIMNDRIIKRLKLSDEQLQTYKDLEKKQQRLKGALYRCNINKRFADKIINITDLEAMPDDDALLDEAIKEEWKEMIDNRSVNNGN